jgi:DNA-binding protein H-NS
MSQPAGFLKARVDIRELLIGFAGIGRPFLWHELLYMLARKPLRSRASWRLAMEGIDLKSMPLDELWALHETICSILARKLEAEKRSLERRLNELRRSFKKASNETPERRPYPKVHPKFRNPKPPHQTWSGRGHQPRWVRELLAAGKTTDDLRIDRLQLRGRPHRR